MHACPNCGSDHTIRPVCMRDAPSFHDRLCMDCLKSYNSKEQPDDQGDESH
jgi:hypothetical protein